MLSRRISIHEIPPYRYFFASGPQCDSQEHKHPAPPATVALQPMALPARQLAEALNYLGQPLTVQEQKRVNEAIGMQDEAAAVEALERRF